LYKRIAIRDARDSLQLNASLWRLSWVTFVFLPLTFVAGLFGMNIDIFLASPSIKW
jgi:Mg2+ and Co2+ transporter CorA